MLMTRVIKVLDLPFHKAFSEALNYLLVSDNSYRVVLNQIILCLTCSLESQNMSEQTNPSHNSTHRLALVTINASKWQTCAMMSVLFYFWSAEVLVQFNGNI